jgi:3D (Asp-Asp-Asp) domain-containing protein
MKQSLGGFMQVQFNRGWILVFGLMVLGCGREGFHSQPIGLEEETQYLGLASEEIPDGYNEADFSGRANLSPTIYFHPLIRDEFNNCRSGEWTGLRNKHGAEMMRVCSTTYKTCTLEGSCQIQRENVVRSFNYEGKTSTHYTFFEIKDGDCVFGYGVRSACLDPFYTVAADLNFHQVGSVIYVPKVKGAKLPNGDFHTGFFVVRDRGGAITGAHRFDFFTGTMHWNDPRNPFRSLGLSDPQKKTPYYRVGGATASQVRLARAYPKLP